MAEVAPGDDSIDSVTSVCSFRLSTFVCFFNQSLKVNFISYCTTNQINKFEYILELIDKC
jgi:hypothetical protein